MAYMNYNNSLYRTGFRPYGQTNAWAASQLNGYDMGEAVLSGYLGQSVPFTRQGGWGLHGSASFHPWVLEGMGDDPTSFITDFGVPGSITQPAIVDCMATPNDPTCGSPLTAEQPYSYGQSTAATNAQLINAAINPSSPGNIQYLPTTIPSSTVGVPAVNVTLAPGPAPRVNIPVTPTYSTPSSSIFTASTIIKGIPDIAVFGLGAVALMSLVGGGRRRR